MHNTQLELGPSFGAALRKNEADHSKDCATSCNTFYCGEVSQGDIDNDPSSSSSTTTTTSSSSSSSTSSTSTTTTTTSNSNTRTMGDVKVAQYSMGDVPPEDFAGAFHYPLDLIKVGHCYLLLLVLAFG
jgi:hypothetical protein